jgi:RimJ/RimL family protein N-acetyltransferase
MSLHKLDPSEYEIARPVFQALDFHLAVPALLAGAARGQVYVDDPAAPRAGLAWTRHRVYLAGAAGEAGFIQALERLLAEVIIPWAAETPEQGFVIYPAPGGAEEATQRVLAPYDPVHAQRLYLVFREPNRPWRALLPPGFELRIVSGQLLNQTTLKNLDELFAEMQSERESPEDFLQCSFGLCPVYAGAEIAGWCLSEYNLGERCEVGIATLEGYRQQGLATLCGSAFIELANAHGIRIIGWHCWSGNQASVATALKIGYERVKEYPASYCPAH